MKKIVLLLMVILSGPMLFAQSTSFFNQTNESSIRSNNAPVQRIIVPSEYEVYSLDLEGLSSYVSNAKSRITTRTSQLSITVPTERGNTEVFSVYDSEVMHPELQAKYPQIRSYFGISQNNPLNKIYFTVTSQGFRGLIKGEKTLYIDPYAKGDTRNYIVYDRKNLSRSSDDDWRCHADELPQEVHLDEAVSTGDQKNLQDGRLRRYEIAIACTSEYTSYHDDGNAGNGDARADALAAMVITVARVNSVYEQDLAMTFQLVPRNDELIYFNNVSVGPNANADPYDNYDGGQMLGVNTSNITGRIGVGSYDIGHVFSTGGGGIAGTSPCTSSSKGRGVTGIVTPEFDPFDIDYVSHEIGHQYSAGHTYYNACFGSKVSDDYEPGSASTIMGYAGICVPNVQENSDAYFHARSIAQITSSVNGDSCETEIVIANDEPVAAAGNDYTIPRSTPFILDGSATTDPNGDALTYCWEQYDNDGSYTQPPVSTNAGGPVFRTNFPTTDPTRTFPNLQAVINNTTPTWEVLPSVGRTMNFRLTVRDNNALGGQTDNDNTVITVSPTAGPFTVSSPNTGAEIWYTGTSETVTWNVNSTNALSPNVNILLSTDGGLTYPITLASNVTNDGSQNITVPNNLGTTNRVKIEAATNIFFDLSNADFEIKAGTYEISATQNTANVCQPANAVYTLDYTPAPGYTENVTFSTVGAPAGSSVNFSPASRNSAGSVTMTVSNTGAVALGNHPFSVQGTSSPSNDTESYGVVLNVFDNNIGNVVLSSPTDGATNQSTSVSLQWQNLTSASGYDIQISTSSTFSSIAESGSVQNATTYQTTSLSAGNLYYWRVRPTNPCINGNYGTIFSFQTANDVCITYDNEYFENNDNTWETGTTNAVSARVDVPDNIILTDVSFYMRADHAAINDIKMQFSSPQGRFAEIYNRDCSGQDFDVTFSDSGTPLTCGDVTGATSADLEGTQQAGQLFTRFHGENAQGTWVLLATDRGANGSGGTFNEFSVTICGELQIVNDITIVNNNLLSINNGQTLTIPQANLEVTQPGAATTDLTYSITDLPDNGTLLLSATPVTIGQTFTQQDINNNLLSYTYSGAAGGTDTFTFSVAGNNSAILGGQIFNIGSPVTAPPVAVCQDITVDLGASGQVTILASAIDNGSTDDGTIASMSLDIDTFDCSTVGPQTVTLTVTDDEGQTDTCTATVTVTHNTPPANLVVSSITSSSALVSWDNAMADAYRIRYRENGTTPWTTISGITTTSTTITGLTPSTMYEVQVSAVCTNSITPYSASTTFTTTDGNVTYCASAGNNSTDEYINNVTIGTINNTSGNDGGYGDYTAVAPTDLEIGSTPTISVDKFINGSFNEAVSVWIDYNKDGDFGDSGEQVITSPSSQTDLTNVSFAAAIPNTANVGTTRMRVAMKYYNAAGSTHTDPCENTFGFGEVEDYTVNITQADPCPTTTTYNAGWGGGIPPTSSIKAIFNSNYNTSTGNIEACTIEIAAGVTVTVGAGQYMRAQGNIVVNGTLIVEHEGSIVQVDNAATTTKGASGVIEIRKTTPTLKPRDLMFMSSPMTGETRDGVYASAFKVLNLVPANFVPDPQVTTQFPGSENFLSTDNTFLGTYTSNEAITPGEGLIVYPQSSITDGNTTYNMVYTKGVLNNGEITFPIQYNGPAKANNFNLLGNPYPSAIDALALIADNAMISEVYFWEHVMTTNPAIQGYLNDNYSMEDYSMRNATGGLAAPNKPSAIPGRYIASGQGFAIKAEQSASGVPTASFTNDMRVVDNNDQYRTNEQADRLWLRVTNAHYELLGNTLIGFMPEATSAMDPGYDSKRLATAISVFTTLKTGEYLGIQGREAFDSSMQIPLGFSTVVEEDLNYVISIDQFEGEHLSSSPVYLVDKLLQTAVNLKEQDYRFVSNEVTSTERFMIAFEIPENLGVEEQQDLAAGIRLYPNPTNNQVTLAYGGPQVLTQAIITDIQGKQVSRVDLSDFVQTSVLDIRHLSAGVYFIQIEGETQTTVKKLVVR